jgi:hypothetical protein
MDEPKRSETPERPSEAVQRTTTSRLGGTRWVGKEGRRVMSDASRKRERGGGRREERTSLVRSGLLEDKGRDRARSLSGSDVGLPLRNDASRLLLLLMLLSSEVSSLIVIVGERRSLRGLSSLRSRGGGGRGGCRGVDGVGGGLSFSNSRARRFESSGGVVDRHRWRYEREVGSMDGRERRGM